MRKATLFGKDVYLTEKEWSVLVGRFDVDKAKEFLSGRKFEIPISCFCEGLPCGQCPLYAWKWGRGLSGCTRALNKLCGTSNLSFQLGMYSVHWWEEDDKKARRQIRKVYSFLMGMEQVKR